MVKRTTKDKSKEMEKGNGAFAPKGLARFLSNHMEEDNGKNT